MEAIKNKKEAIEIISKKLNHVFDMGLRQSPFDGNNSEFYRPFIEFDLAPDLYEELLKNNKK